MDTIMRLSQSTLMVKLDIKSAFRLCPVHSEDHHHLGFQWDGKSCHLAYALLLKYSTTSHVLSSQHLGVGVKLHYLDDFFPVGEPDSPECARYLHTLIQLCKDLGAMTT